MRVSAEVAARDAIEAGVRLLQYRDKSGTRRAIFEVCHRLSVLLKRSNAVFIVNDHPDIALAVDAAGVHLGQDDLPAEDARMMLGSGKISEGESWPILTLEETWLTGLLKGIKFGKVEQEAKFEGRNFITILAPLQSPKPT